MSPSLINRTVNSVTVYLPFGGKKRFTPFTSQCLLDCDNLTLSIAAVLELGLVWKSFNRVLGYSGRAPKH